MKKIPMTPGGRIQALLKLRPRLTTTAIADVLCMPYADADEEVAKLYNAGLITAIQSSLGLMAWVLAARDANAEQEEDDDQGKGQGSASLTLDMKEPSSEHQEEQDLPGKPSAEELDDCMKGFHDAVREQAVIRAAAAMQAALEANASSKPKEAATEPMEPPKPLFGAKVGMWRQQKVEKAAKPASPPAPANVALMAYHEWQKAIEESKQAWKNKNKKGGLK